MKKLFLLTTIVIFFAFCLEAQITMNSTGKVGIKSSINTSYEVTIGTTVLFKQGVYPGITIEGGGPGYGLNIVPTSWGVGRVGRSDKPFGEIHCMYLYKENSDSTLKENIRNIDNSLDIILKLRGIRFDFKKNVVAPGTYADNEKINLSIEEKRKNNIGFIAQEMKDILPEAVNYDDSTNLYSIDYTLVIPVIVEAIKEQQTIIKNLQTEIQELKKDNNTDNLKSGNLITETMPLPVNGSNILYQNSPNPFSQSTTIKYSITENIQKAMICIYDMNGTQLKCIPLHLKGNSIITINGYELKAGMYMYALIVDGQLIDTKRMILTN